MAGDSEILQEYLVKLGWSVDNAAQRKIDEKLEGTKKRMGRLGIAAITAVASVAASTTAYAYYMRRMYYASELMNTPIANLMAMKFAGEQFGISGDAMESTLHALAQNLRLNPGMLAFASGLTGINEAGKTADQTLMDLVRTTRHMPEYQAAQIMQMFGVDPNTYHLMRTHMDALMAKQRQMMRLWRETGVDPQKGAAALKDYANALTVTEEHLTALEMALGERFQKPFHEMINMVNYAADWWIKWAQGVHSVKSEFSGLGKALFNLFGSEWRRFIAYANASDSVPKGNAPPTATLGVSPVGNAQAGAPVVVHHSSTINVTGASSPEEVANLVAKKQQAHSRQYGDVVRHMTGKTR